MANTYHQIYLQTVFAVKYREAVIKKEWQAQLFLGLKPVVAVSELMQTVKAKSSKYINDHSLTLAVRMAGRLRRILLWPIPG